MNSYEPASVVFTRLQSLDPDNASKIMGYILLQDPTDRELRHLAFSSDAALHALIVEAKSYLRLSSNGSPASPFSSSFNPNSKNPFSTRSSASITSGTNRYLSSNPSSPSSSTWQPNGAMAAPVAVAAASASSLSYAAVLNGSNGSNGSSNSGMNNGNSALDAVNGGSPVEKDIPLVEDALPFDNMNSGLDGDRNSINSTVHQNQNLLLHRRSLSLSDVGFGNSFDENSSSPVGFVGWRPCMYFARGHCKNGASCNFSHSGGFADSGGLDGLGSPNSSFEHELLRSKAAAHRQRFAVASQLMGGTGTPFPYHKGTNFLNDSPRSLAAGLVMGDDFNKFGRFRFERNDFAGMGYGATSPGSRQIYLTFPADSTFREEDVSSYFSTFGPVEDVRIPYQAKRMFGFVTFLYPETVEQILAIPNPHFVCDSRVLVKPYKEKGKVDKKQQQFERGDLSSCLSPHGSDLREPFDIRVGPRMFYNSQEMMLRRKLEEQADLQQAIELQERRIMNLQLLDLKNRSLQHCSAYQHGLPPNISIPSPALVHRNQNLTSTLNAINQGAPPVSELDAVSSTSPNVAVDGHLLKEGYAGINVPSDGYHTNNKEMSSLEEFELSLDDILLPDNLFGSPKKSLSEDQPATFSSVLLENEEKQSYSSASSPTNNGVIPSSAGSLSMAPPKSCFFEMPRFSSGHGVIEM